MSENMFKPVVAITNASRITNAHAENSSRPSYQFSSVLLCLPRASFFVFLFFLLPLSRLLSGFFGLLPLLQNHPHDFYRLVDVDLR
jgi:hypothetical protein